VGGAVFRLPKLALRPWLTGPAAGLVLTNARVVDPAGSRLLPGLQSVIIKSGRIIHVYPVDEPDLLANELSLTTVDLDGQYLCP